MNRSSMAKGADALVNLLAVIADKGAASVLEDIKKESAGIAKARAELRSDVSTKNDLVATLDARLADIEARAKKNVSDAAALAQDRARFDDTVAASRAQADAAKQKFDADVLSAGSHLAGRTDAVEVRERAATQRESVVVSRAADLDARERDLKQRAAALAAAEEDYASRAAALSQAMQPVRSIAR